MAENKSSIMIVRDAKDVSTNAKKTRGHDYSCGINVSKNSNQESIIQFGGRRVRNRAKPSNSPVLVSRLGFRAKDSDPNELFGVTIGGDRALKSRETALEDSSA